MSTPKLPLEIHEIVFECISDPHDAQNFYHAMFTHCTKPTCSTLAEFLNFVMKSGRYSPSRKLNYLMHPQFDSEEYRDMFKINIQKPTSLFHRLILKMGRFRALTCNQTSPCPSRS